MRISRDKYVNDLEVRRENGMVKVVTGVRRCGKTYLLFDLFKESLLASGVDESHIVELALDLQENAQYRDPDALYSFLLDKLSSDGGMHYVLLDEIQYAISDEELRNPSKPPRLYGVLNGLLRRPNADVYVTGSNSKLLSKDVMTEFRGRGDEVHVLPLVFSEFMQVYDGDRRDGWDEYVMYGGMPLAATMRTDGQKMRYLSSLFEEVYLRDIVERNHVTKTEELEDLVDVLASAIGSLTNPAKIEATFESVLKSKLTRGTADRFIGYLEDAFLVAEAKRYDVKGRKYIGSPKKYYFEDVGLRNARLGFRQVEESHLMENVIYNELRYRGFAVDVGVVDRRVRDDAGRQGRVRYECDFVANLGYRRYYVQSALSIPDEAKRRQETESLRNIDDSFRKIVVVKDAGKPYMDEDGILTMGLYDFLLDPSSLNF